MIRVHPLPVACGLALLLSTGPLAARARPDGANAGTAEAGTARAAVAQPAAPMLVDVAWLAEHLHDPDLVLLHVGQKEEYDAGHIPGARFIRMQDVSTPHNMEDGSLMLELPSAAELRQRLEKFGISDDSRIVVYYGNDWVSPTTRVIFTLDYLGLGDHTSLLNGGMQAWKQAGNELSADVPAPAQGRLSARPTLDRVVDAAFVRTIADRKHTRLIDARAAKFYDGLEEASGRKGHIPGAISIPFTDIADDELMIRPEALKARFQEAGIEPGDTIVAYCHVGQQATAVVFAARLLGYEARLYDGSMDDWSRHEDWPVVAGNTPSGGNR